MGAILPVENYRSLGQLIRQERKNKDLTQTELAKKIGTTFSHVSKWETDKNSPGDDYLIKLSNVLSIPIEILRRQRRVDEVEEASIIAEPWTHYGDNKEEAIKNLETAQYLIKLTIDKLKTGE